MDRSDDAQYMIIDQRGVVLYEDRLFDQITEKNQLKINEFRNYTPGVYYLILGHGNNTLVKKIVKE